MHNNEGQVDNNIDPSKQRCDIKQCCCNIQISAEYAHYCSYINHDIQDLSIQFLESISQAFNRKQQQIELIFQDLAFELKPQSNISFFDYFSSRSSQSRSKRKKDERSNYSFISTHSLDSQSGIQLVRSRSIGFRSKALRKLRRLKPEKSQGSVACFDS